MKLENAEDHNQDDEFVPITIYIIVTCIFLLNIGQFLRNAALRYFSYKRLDMYWKKINRFNWIRMELTKAISDISIVPKVQNAFNPVLNIMYEC